MMTSPFLKFPSRQESDLKPVKTRSNVVQCLSLSAGLNTGIPDYESPPKLLDEPQWGRRDALQQPRRGRKRWVKAGAQRLSFKAEVVKD